MRKFHGNVVGRKSSGVWVCSSCLHWHKSRQKYGCEMAGCGRKELIFFPSEAEARRHSNLRQLQAAGEIMSLELQPSFPIFAVTPDGENVKIGEYRADFRYMDCGSESVIVEDVKGSADTHISAWKRKHCEAQYGIKISIVKS